jgi:hypothetical protein
MLQKQPVLYHFLAIGGEHTLRMELDASNVEALVAQGHDLPFIAYSRYL